MSVATGDSWLRGAMIGLLVLVVLTPVFGWAAGAVGYAAAGWGAALPAGASGYLYWPAIAMIAVAAMLTAPLGARLAHRLPVRQLRRLFAVLLLLVAADMLMN